MVFLRNIKLFISVENAIELDPEDYHLWLKKTKYLKQLNRVDEALEWYFC